MIRTAVVSKLRVMALSGLILGLAGCGTTGFIAPPADLVADCPKASPDVRTNLDLAAGYNLRGRQLDDCNADKAAIRAWIAEMEAKK